jgi:hypothetical protein
MIENIELIRILIGKKRMFLTFPRTKGRGEDRRSREGESGLS